MPVDWHDKNNVLAAVQQNGSAFERASGDLKKDKEVALAAVQNSLMAMFRCTECSHITVVPRPRSNMSMTMEGPMMSMVPATMGRPGVPPPSNTKMQKANSIMAYCLTCKQDYHLPLEFVRDLECVECSDGTLPFEYLDRRKWHRPADISELRYHFKTGDCFTTSVQA